MNTQAACLGYPRFGVQRELKKALEGHWAGRLDAAALQRVARELRARHWTQMREAGIDQVPSNDFSLYDHVLDMAVTLGVVPARYRVLDDPLARYFAMARGHQDRSGETPIDVSALEMTKWLDTNYHYIVPELAQDQTFALDAHKILGEVAEARALGLETRPVILGPVSFLRLAKMAPGTSAPITPLDHLEALLPVYAQLLERLTQEHVAWVQLDEPCLVLDLDAAEQAAYRRALAVLGAQRARPRLMLTSYFGGLHDNLALASGAGLDGVHVDLVRAPDQLDAVLAAVGDASRWPAEACVSLGLVDGRNVWRRDLDAAHTALRTAVRALGAARVWVAPSCSLLHVPEDLAAETKLDAELASWLAFARQKLDEVVALARSAAHDEPVGEAWREARAAIASRRRSPRTRNAAVRARVSAVTEAQRTRAPFAVRKKVQTARFSLPLLPTTTIGSFPQTAEVRSHRAAWRTGRSSDAAYEAFLREETRRCVERQEALGLDVLVHGEFERTDMVEHFGEKLAGFAFTELGWVQSYGSRCVKPPILFGDVARPEAMTVRWSQYAQSLTTRPMKGMLTGPVTILQWSFVRDDQPRRETCEQVALALRDEVVDLEAAGIGMVQVDEPALREGLPLRREDWDAYLRWAVDAFRLCTAGVGDATQIHTHMCYAEFGDILDAIAAMDADVLSIETSRSKMEILDDFGRFHYPNEVGPGVYDIHSPRVPSAQEMLELVVRAAEVLPLEQLWVNPDCGLKTRGWPEVEAALSAMVSAARRARAQLRAREGEADAR